MPKIVEEVKRGRPIAVGAYIFAGGFTVGVRRYFDVLCHLEEGPYGVSTAKRNMPDLPVHVGLNSWPVDELAAEEVDFLYGNPPCAAWSQAGAATKKGRTWDSSSLVACTERHFDLLIRVKPKVWAWESVQRAWTLGRSLVDRLAEMAMAEGYSVTILLHDAQYLGVPQTRKRFFMVCHRVELEFSEPDWKVQTIDDALAGVVDPGEPLEHNLGKHRAILDKVRPGEQLSSAWTRLTPESNQVRGERGQMVGRPPFTIKRSRSGQPAPVVMHELIHPTEPRGLSIKELATLCGYPQDYEFVNCNDAGQVGRGVCPPVGAYLAKNVRVAVKMNVKVIEPAYRLVDIAKPPMKTSELRVESPSSSSIIVTREEEEKGEIKVEEEIENVETKPTPKIVPMSLTHSPQRQATRQGIDPDREYDKTSLRANAHGKWVHRDYGAHFFRWGFASRMVNSETSVLDVGCGPDCPLIEVLTMPRSSVPKRYVGVDFNNEPRKHPMRGWATTLWGFDFLKRHAETVKDGKFDLVVNFEVIEHMRKTDGLRLLAAMRSCLKLDGRILLSTPVFNGKAAANHIHEWTVSELEAAVTSSGLSVVKRHGTFASQNDLKKVASAADLDVVKRLSAYYSGEVLSCFLAPLYPDASRNNVWVLKKNKSI